MPPNSACCTSSARLAAPAGAAAARRPSPRARAAAAPRAAQTPAAAAAVAPRGGPIRFHGFGPAPLPGQHGMLRYKAVPVVTDATATSQEELVEAAAAFLDDPPSELKFTRTSGGGARPFLFCFRRLLSRLTFNAR